MIDSPDYQNSNHNVFFIGGNKMSQNKTQHSEESAKTFTDEH